MENRMDDELKKTFKNLNLPFFSTNIRVDEKQVYSTFKLLRKWLVYYKERLPNPNFSSYKDLEDTHQSYPKLKEITRAVQYEHQNPSPKYLTSVGNYSPKLVRQTAMRVLFNIVNQSRIPKAEEYLVDEQLPSPLGAFLISQIVPKISYEDNPLSENIFNIQKSYRRYLSLLTANEIPLLSLYYHRPSLIDTFFPKSKMSDIILESKIALTLTHSDLLRSLYLYGKNDEKWLFGFFKRVYQEHSCILGALSSLAALSSNSPSAFAFNLTKKAFKLTWNISDFTDTEKMPFQKYIQSIHAHKLTEDLSNSPLSQQMVGLAISSDYMYKKYHQCKKCYTLYSSPAGELPFSKSSDECPVCLSFSRILLYYIKNDKTLSEEDKKLSQLIFNNLHSKSTKNNFQELNFQDILFSLPFFESVHNQSWAAYKKLAFQIFDDHKRSVLLDNFLDNYFVYKFQIIFPEHPYYSSEQYEKTYQSISDKLKSGHYFIKYSPWSRSFLKPKPKSAKDWAKSFLSYLTFPFPPSSLFYYKTFGDLDARMESPWRGSFITTNHEIYMKETSIWSEDIFRLADAHITNSFYKGKETSKKKPLIEINKSLKNWMSDPKNDAAKYSVSLQEVQKKLDNNLKSYQGIPLDDIPKRIIALDELHFLSETLIKNSKGSSHLERLIHSISDEQKSLKTKKSL